MFFFPLPLKRTFEPLDQVESSKTALPDPELYIIVNGKSAESEFVWCYLVDVDRVKKVDKLRQINQLCEDVVDNAADDSIKQVIEVVNSTTTSMLEKADESDIAGFQAYTVTSLQQATN